MSWRESSRADMGGEIIALKHQPDRPVISRDYKKEVKKCDRAFLPAGSDFGLDNNLRKIPQINAKYCAVLAMCSPKEIRASEKT